MKQNQLKLLVQQYLWTLLFVSILCMQNKFCFHVVGNIVDFPWELQHFSDCISKNLHQTCKTQVLISVWYAHYQRERKRANAIAMQVFAPIVFLLPILNRKFSKLLWLSLIAACTHSTDIPLLLKQSMALWSFYRWYNIFPIRTVT